MEIVMSIAKAPARRKDPVERRAEIVAMASRIALGEGLERVTAKHVADELGVVPGLVNHYFGAVDDLVAASFRYAVLEERAEIYGAAYVATRPLDQLRRLMAEFLIPDRDAVSLLWLDAWQASRRRPALLVEVVAQMDADSAAMAGLIEAGVAAGDFRTDDPLSAATRIMALVDGWSVQAVTRSKIDYSTVSAMVIRTTEFELGLKPGGLATGDPGIAD
jgi:AcrR family transcriptional regulator